MKHGINSFAYIFFSLFLLLSASCSSKSSHSECWLSEENVAALTDSLETIAGEYPGEIGIAMISGGGDIVLVGNEDKYPLMSVFKLHQAISLCDLFESRGTSLDSVVNISRSELNPDTWSPMLKDHAEDTISISVRELLRYTLMQSDNNASNYMFEHMQSVAEADSFISTLIPRESFSLKVTEAQMWDDHSLCYYNHTSPFGAASLIFRLYNGNMLSPDKRDFICTTLEECRTGTDRIVAPLVGIEGLVAGHKTGSGFRNADGILTAHNDVAFITMPDGRSYSLAVFVKDFNGTEKSSASAIARISEAVYSFLSKSGPKSE